MRISIMTALLILLTSCVSTNYYEHTIHGWRGHQTSELTASWGQPDQLIRLADGSQTLIYNKRMPLYFGNTDYQTIVFAAGNKNIGVQVPRNLPKTTMISCSTLFNVNKQNTITGVRSEGGGCAGLSLPSHKIN